MQLQESGVAMDSDGDSDSSAESCSSGVEPGEAPTESEQSCSASIAAGLSPVVHRFFKTLHWREDAEVPMRHYSVLICGRRSTVSMVCMQGTAVRMLAGLSECKGCSVALARHHVE